MIRIMIVDDEFIVRVGIKSMIDWNSQGFSIIGEASDGEDALLKIPELNPHILLTDIKMPKMDGIDLIKAVREKYKNIKILVLSCHNDFDFVKQAMKLGASDYILKLSMEPEELIEVLKGLKTQIDESREKVSDESILKIKINSNMDVIKEKFFKKIINGGYLSTVDIYKEAKNFGIKFIEANYFVLVTKINRCFDEGKVAKLEPDLLRYSILNIMEEALNKDFYGDVFAYDNETFVTFITVNKSDNIDNINEKYNIFANHVQELLETYLNISVSSGYDSVTVVVPNDIKHAYNRALTACEHRFYFDKSIVINYSELKYLKIINDYFNIEFQKELYNCIKVGENERIIELINELFKDIIKNHELKPQDIKQIVHQIVYIFSQASREMNLTDQNENKPDICQKANEIDGIDNIYSLFKWLENFNIEYFINLYNTHKGIYSKGIMKLKQYVNENYDREISLESASKFLNIGKNYFCSIFKKEAGETFYDYLIKIRMEKAKELLRNTGMKNYEVAEKVGYSNFNYFSTLFKKITGVSPNEYRKG